MSHAALQWTCALVALASLLAEGRVSAQGAQSRAYQTDRADEDWSFLRTAPDVDAWDPLKYIPLGRDTRFMTLSGEVRFRPEGLRIRATSARPSTIDNYLLQRYLFGADVHVGRTRVFTEIQSGVINGALRSPRPTDQNSLDLHQAFVEWKQPIRGESRILIKAGRQELAIGSARLISASPGLNVKRSFDGVATTYAAGSWAMTGAVARLVALRSGNFDDWANTGQLFWGAAASWHGPRLHGGDAGAYYLGIDRSLSLYPQGAGPETRHTAGIKWNIPWSRLALNYDAVFQWGRFADAPIRAWAVATETAMQLSSSGWRPRVSLRTDFASGDRDAADARLESFNPLFPGNSYAGPVGLLGPTNLIDVTPSFSLRPRAGVSLGFEAPSYWRTSTADGVYSTDLRLLVGPEGSTKKYVGTNPAVLAVWQVTRHAQLTGVVTRFLSGPVLKPTFVSSGFGFYSASFVYRF